MSAPVALRAVRREPDPAGAAVEATAIGVRIRLVVTEPAALEEALALLDAEIAALDLACSRFRDDSELRRLDRAAGREVEVSDVLAGALEAALRAARLTDGDVDPTLGTAMAEVGYDRDFGDVAPSGPPVRVTVRPAVGWRTVHLDPSARTVRMPAGTRLDLGATAKAWAADRIAEAVGTRLGTGVLVSLGGDVAVAGTPPPGGWLVGVSERPDDSGPHQCVTVHDGGLATSTTTARRWVRGDRVLHHILDPRSGLPAGGAWRTATVAAATCLDANTASTAAIVRGAGAVSWLRRAGLPARLVDRQGAVTTVAGWPEEVAA